MFTAWGKDFDAISFVIQHKNGWVSASFPNGTSNVHRIARWSPHGELNARQQVAVAFEFCRVNFAVLRELRDQVESLKLTICELHVMSDEPRTGSIDIVVPRELIAYLAKLSADFNFTSIVVSG